MQSQLQLQLFSVKEVGRDYIVLVDDTTSVKITFAGGSGTPASDLDPPVTKEENAKFFETQKRKGLKAGLEAPVRPLNKPQTINIFLDHYVDLFGWLRSIPFPFPVSRIEVSEIARGHTAR